MLRQRIQVTGLPASPRSRRKGQEPDGRSGHDRCRRQRLCHQTLRNQSNERSLHNQYRPFRSELQGNNSSISFPRLRRMQDPLQLRLRSLLDRPSNPLRSLLHRQLRPYKAILPLGTRFPLKSFFGRISQKANPCRLLQSKLRLCSFPDPKQTYSLPPLPHKALQNLHRSANPSRKTPHPLDP